MITKRMCKALAAARLAKGMSLSQLGDKLGMSRTNLSALEHGRRMPSLKLLAKWCKAVGYEAHLTIQPSMKTTIKQIERSLP